MQSNLVRSRQRVHLFYSTQHAHQNAACGSNAGAVSPKLDFAKVLHSELYVVFNFGPEDRLGRHSLFSNLSRAIFKSPWVQDTISELITHRHKTASNSVRAVDKNFHPRAARRRTYIFCHKLGSYEYPKYGALQRQAMSHDLSLRMTRP